MEIFCGEQLAKVGKTARIATMPVAEIPVALAWAHPLVAEWFLGEVRVSD